MATTKMENVFATPAGKARNAASGMTSVKWPIAQAEDDARKDTVNASRALLENFAKKVKI